MDELVDELVDEPVDKPTNTLIDDIDAGSQLIGDATVLVEALRMEALFRHQRKLCTHLETIDKRLNKIETHLAAMRSSEYGSKAKAKLAWPIGSMDRLKNLEERLRTGEAGIENSLKMLFARARQTSLEIFVTDNLKQMLGSSGRWTWTGLPPNSLKTGAQQHSSNKASELLCVQVLIDYCEELFNDSSSKIIGEIKHAFKKINEARKKKEQRNKDSLRRSEN